MFEVLFTIKVPRGWRPNLYKFLTVAYLISFLGYSEANASTNISCRQFFSSQSNNSQKVQSPQSITSYSRKSLDDLGIDINNRNWIKLLLLDPSQQIDSDLYAQAYIRNVTDSIRKIFAPAFENGELLTNFEEVLSAQNKILILGSDGYSHYGGHFHVPNPDINSAVQYAGLYRSNKVILTISDFVQMSSVFALGIGNKVEIPNIPVEMWPINQNGNHYYPPPTSIPLFLAQMKKIMGNFMSCSQCTEQQKIQLLADYYHTGINSHLFPRVNQSLLMSQVNYILLRMGFQGIPHASQDLLSERLDSVAGVMSQNDFRTYFTNQVYRIPVQLRGAGSFLELTTINKSDPQFLHQALQNFDSPIYVEDSFSSSVYLAKGVYLGGTSHLLKELFPDIQNFWDRIHQPVIVKVPFADFRHFISLRREGQVLNRLKLLDPEGLFVRGIFSPYKGFFIERYDPRLVPLKSWISDANSHTRFKYRSRIAEQLKRALLILKSAGIVHSDLNTSNVLINPENGRIKIRGFEKWTSSGELPPQINFGNNDSGLKAQTYKDDENAVEKIISQIHPNQQEIFLGQGAEASVFIGLNKKGDPEEFARKEYHNLETHELDIKLMTTLESIYEKEPLNTKSFKLAKYRKTTGIGVTNIEYIDGSTLRDELLTSPVSAQGRRHQYYTRINDMIIRLKKLSLFHAIREVKSNDPIYPRLFTTPGNDGCSVFFIYVRNSDTNEILEYIIKSDNILVQFATQDMWIIDPG